MISERPGRVVMIGAPVTGVRTPPMLAAFLADNGRPSPVEVAHVEPGDLAAFMARTRTDEAVDGLMVTMPHKRAILPHLDALSDAAAQARSVNAVKRLDGRLVGAQFDGIGLCNALDAAGADLPGAWVWLKGLGGAGLAITLALTARGAGALLVSEIDGARVAAAQALLPSAIFLDPADTPHADILVNATPLGMTAGDPSPFTADSVATARLVADIVADPHATRLAALAEDTGTGLVTGRQMVANQVPPIGRWLLSADLQQEF
ncbi:MAG: shikimate dehydrogenase [Acuticoccus sp.]